MPLLEAGTYIAVADEKYLYHIVFPCFIRAQTPFSFSFAGIIYAYFGIFTPAKGVK